MLSRNAKRIASRSQIRLQTPIAKGHQQRCAKPKLTGIDTGTGTADEILDGIGRAERQGNRLLIGREQRMAIPDEERMTTRVATGGGTRPHMRIEARIAARMAIGVGTALGNRIVTPLDMPLGKRVHMRVPKGVNTRVMMRIGKWLEK